MSRSNGPSSEARVCCVGRDARCPNGGGSRVHLESDDRCSHGVLGQIERVALAVEPFAKGGAREREQHDVVDDAMLNCPVALSEMRCAPAVKKESGERQE